MIAQWTLRASSARRADRARVPVLLALLLALIAWYVPPGPVAAESFADLGEPGPFEVVTLEVTVPRTRGGEGSFDARVFVPLPDAQAAEAPASPAVAFGHGFLASVDWYESTLAHLASWGIVVIAPRSASELFPDHAAFASDLLSSLDWVVSTATADEVWPGGPVDPAALGLSGHSMGGGAALLAAARDPAIGAVATLAAAETDPSAIEASAASAAPALFLAASQDRITPVSDHQRSMFEAKASGRVQLRTIEGASHCGFLDMETALLGLVCDEADIGAEEQRRITREVLTAWLLHELVGDASLGALAWPETPDGPTLVESR